MNSDNIFRPATQNDLHQIAHVHVFAFPGFFLTILGFGFLKVMYRAFLSSESSIFIVSEDDGKIGGFAVGVLQSAGKDKKLALRFLPHFIWAVIPAFVRNPFKVTSRIASQLLTDGGQPPMPSGSAVLRSIGVLPENKGKGIANKLLDAFEQLAKKKNAISVALTTDARNNERAIGFYLKNGYQIREKFIQNETREMLLLVKPLI